jgi:hypothetical protein
MRHAGLVLVIGVVVAVAVLCVGAASPEPLQASSEIEQFKKEVAALRRRVEFLEKRLKDDSISAPPKEGKARPDVIKPYPGLHQAPQSWRRFEFNGMPYYVVPIDNTPKSASEAKKQVPPGELSAAPKAADSQ